MNREENEKAAMFGDMSSLATGNRLRAARYAAGYKSRSDAAYDIGINAKTLGSQETGKTLPSSTVLRHYFLVHKIDMNFLMFGDFSGLDTDTQSALMKELTH